MKNARVYYYPENISTYTPLSLVDVVNSAKGTQFELRKIKDAFYSQIDSLINITDYKKVKSKGFSANFVVELSYKDRTIFVLINSFGDYRRSDYPIVDSAYETNGKAIKILESNVKGLRKLRKKYK